MKYGKLFHPNPAQEGPRWLQKHSSAKIKTSHPNPTLQEACSEADSDMMTDGTTAFPQSPNLLTVIFNFTTQMVRLNGHRSVCWESVLLYVLLLILDVTRTFRP